MTLAEIKAEIIDACAKFKAAGYKLVDGDFCEVAGDANNLKVCGGCALTAVYFVHSGKPLSGEEALAADVRAFAQRRYGWLSTWPFTDGFDGLAVSVSAKELHALGVEVRQVVFS